MGPSTKANVLRFTANKNPDSNGSLIERVQDGCHADTKNQTYFSFTIGDNATKLPQQA